LRVVAGQQLRDLACRRRRGLHRVQHVGRGGQRAEEHADVDDERGQRADLYRPADHPVPTDEHHRHGGQPEAELQHWPEHRVERRHPQPDAPQAARGGAEQRRVHVLRAVGLDDPDAAERLDHRRGGVGDGIAFRPAHRGEPAREPHREQRAGCHAGQHHARQRQVQRQHRDDQAEAGQQRRTSLRGDRVIQRPAAQSGKLVAE
jgi:hypothetical protein